MRGAALPAALLCLALGLMLGFAPRRAILPAFVLLALVACVVAIGVPVRANMVEVAFAGCWVSIVVMCLAVHLPRGVPLWLALGAAADAGLWAGGLIAVQGARLDLARALPCALAALPATWIARRGWAIGLKVVSSWLIAIAVLAALLPTTPTPGYVPDHMD